jgi:hypothetical protein
LELAWVQFHVARSLRITLAGQVFTIKVAVVAPIQPTIGPKAFMTDKALDLPLCENINDTIRILLMFKNKHSLEKFLQDKPRKPLYIWKNNYAIQH